MFGLASIGVVIFAGFLKNSGVSATKSFCSFSTVNGVNRFNRLVILVAFF